MKEIFILIFAFSFSLHLTFAQKVGTASTGPIPIMKIEKKHSQINSAENKNLETAYGHSSLQEYTLSMRIPEGTPIIYLSQWTPPVFASSMVNQPWSNYYYITEIGPPSALYEMNSETGVVTLVGYITGLTGSDQPNGISYNSANGNYYIISSTNLYPFDPLTLNAILIGSLNNSGLMIDLCFDWSGVCYAYDVYTDNAYTINISTGNTTLLGPLGYDANFGQGMSFDWYSGIIYLSAFNNGTVSGQLRTMDPATGMTTLITDWGWEQIAPFSLPGVPCMSPVGQPTNLSPPYGATNIPISGVTLEWMNGVYTVNVEVWFGIISNVVKVYDGPAITSWTSDALLYNTDYKWFIVDKDTICGGAQGNTWIFTTEQDPNLKELFFDDFSDGTGNWTITNDGGNCVWDISSLLRPYTLPSAATGIVFAADADLCGQGTTLLSTATITQTFNFSVVSNSTIEFDNDWKVLSPIDEAHIEISTDGGFSWSGIWDYVGVSIRNTHEIIDASILDRKPDVKIRLRSVQPDWDWWWAIDNFQIYGSSIPVGISQGIEENKQVPLEFSLKQNYPNPFNPTTKIIWQSPASSWQTLKIYDVLGKEVATLVDGYQPVGNYEIEFDAKNLSSGIYFYQLKSGSFIETKKMILLK